MKTAISIPDDVFRRAERLAKRRKVSRSQLYTVALVQLPLGLNLQAGAKFQVDDGKSIDLPIQTCENRGCYASFPIPADTLNALRSGKQLKIIFQDLGKEAITIPLPLADFAAAYDKIK